MKALVVYESMFGNTQQIAEAIADGLSSAMTVQLAEAASAPLVLADEISLLVAGGPTHAFGLSRANTRASAASQGAVRPHATGLRDWLDTVDPGSPGRPAAAFDTRIQKPRALWAFGTAGRAVDKRLLKLGWQPITSPEGFLVTATPGPLADGEAGRARRWAAELGTRFSAGAAA